MLGLEMNLKPASIPDSELVRICPDEKVEPLPPIEVPVSGSAIKDSGVDRCERQIPRDTSLTERRTQPTPIIQEGVTSQKPNLLNGPASIPDSELVRICPDGKVEPLPPIEVPVSGSATNSPASLTPSGQ